MRKVDLHKGVYTRSVHITNYPHDAPDCWAGRGSGGGGGRGGGGGEKEKGESTDSTHLLLGVLLLDVILLFSPSMICSSPLSSLSSFCFSPNSSCFLIKMLKIQLSRQSHIYSHITLDPFSDPCLYNISTFFPWAFWPSPFSGFIMYMALLLTIIYPLPILGYHPFRSITLYIVTPWVHYMSIALPPLIHYQAIK